MLIDLNWRKLTSISLNSTKIIANGHKSTRQNANRLSTFQSCYVYLDTVKLTLNEIKSALL